MVAKKEIAPELLAEARRLYEQTLAPVLDIRAMLGLSRTNFYKRVKEGGWRGRRARAGTFQFANALSATALAPLAAEPAEQLRAEILPPATPVSPQQRAMVAQRIMSVVEREMNAVERIIENIRPKNQAEAEHGARTLASVSRTLREIAALNRPEEVMPPDDPEHDPIPRDIDEFRNELARRINEFVDAKRSRESGTGGDTVDGVAASRS